MQTDFESIITIKQIDSMVLLIQSNDGRIDLLERNFQKKLTIWDQNDYRICYNFAWRRKSSSIEIVFSKYQSFVIVDFDPQNFNLIRSNEFCISDNKTDLERHEDLFAVFNLNDHYCLTTMTDDLFAFKPDRTIRTGSEQNDNDGDDDDDDDDDERQERIFMRKLIIPSHRKFDDIHFVSVAQTSNCALIALLCYQSRFSGRLNNFKSQNTILYLGTIATPQTMIDRLRWKILQPLRTIEESDNNRNDLADLLFWFRWSLLTKDFSQLKSIITILLRKVPIWICKHSGEAIVNTFECLFRLKAFRVLSKYCLQESEQSLIDENDLIRLKKLIKKLNFLILRNVFQRIFKSPMFDDYEKLQSADDEWLLRFSIEQLLSIWNLNKTGIIDHFSNDQMERLSSLLHSTTKISWPRFQSAQFYLNEMKLEPFSLPLIEYNLRCPLCLMKIDEDLDKVFEQNYLDCKGHTIDFDQNSFLLIDPSLYSIELCRKCWDSKLLIIKEEKSIDDHLYSDDDDNDDDERSYKELWSNSLFFPFRNSPKTCFYCF
ncbi:hypothetical protein SSS_08130 [Sarcoptes scabiei]|uniref:Uncharacterized protein n=1 Tax=Sarcoptes scabiei TaxID=52283 RepID=A0A834VFG9_SARSC|nr:hypothetical protein SSS_08130 [Sarcoptes scabiei]